MPFVLQQPEIFWDDFLSCVAQAKNTVSIRVMEFEAGAKTKKLAVLLKQKLKEGIEVILFVDWAYSKYVHGEIDLLPVLNKQRRAYHAKLHTRTRQLLEELRTAGASVSVTNIPNRLQALLPISGRNHTKIYIADNAVWIGGVHPVDSAFRNIDFMVKMKSPKIVAIMKDYTAPKKNQIISVDNGTQVLFDSGKIGESCIYKQAISLIEQADNEIIFMSQFVPDGKILDKLIMKAKQGVRIAIITSTKKAGVFTKFPANIAYRISWSKADREKNIRFIHCESVVHAKLLIVDRKKVLFGSHNFVGVGVWLGTEEVCIMSQDGSLIKDFIQYIFKSIPKIQEKFI